MVEAGPVGPQLHLAGGLASGQTVTRERRALMAWEEALEAGDSDGGDDDVEAEQASLAEADGTPSRERVGESSPALAAASESGRGRTEGGSPYEDTCTRRFSLFVRGQRWAGRVAAVAALLQNQSGACWGGLALLNLNQST